MLVIRAVESPPEELDRCMQGKWLWSKYGMRGAKVSGQAHRKNDRNGKNGLSGCAGD